MPAEGIAAEVPGAGSARELRPSRQAPAAPQAGQRGAGAEASTPRQAGLAEVAKGGTLNLAGAAVSAAATLALTVIVARSFSKPVVGAFFAATSLYLIVEAIANLGAYNGVIYFTARLRSVREETKVPAMLRYAFWPVLVTSVVAAACLLVLAEPLARRLLGGGLDHGADPAAVATALRALAVAIPFAALADSFLGASRAYRDMRPTVVVDRIGRSCLQLLAVVVAALAGSAGLLAPLWALPYVPAALLAWLWLRRVRRTAQRRAVPPCPGRELAGRAAIREANRSRQLSDASWRTFWRFTAPRSLATVAQIVIQRLDIVLVGIMRGPVEAAVYAAATRFLVVGQLGNAAISMAAQPQFTHLFAVRDRRGANTVYQATTAWLILLTWPLYLLAIFYGPQVLAIFGHSYRAGSLVMVILGLAMLVATGCGQVDMVLTTAGRTSWSLANGLLAVTVNVGVDILLIPRYGITGAAIGWAAAIAITNLVPLAQVAAIIRVHPFGRGTLAACLLTALSFCAVPLAIRALAGQGAAASGAAIAAGFALMAIGLWWCRGVFQLAVMPGVSFLHWPSRGMPGLTRKRRGGGHRK